MPFTAAEIAAQIQGQVEGDGSVVLTGLAPADRSRPGDLTFAENEAYFGRAEESEASAILVGDNFTASKKVLIRVANARVAFAKVLALFFPPPKFSPGIHPSAVIASSAQIDSSAYIGPHCAIGEKGYIGPRVCCTG